GCGTYPPQVYFPQQRYPALLKPNSRFVGEVACFLRRNHPAEIMTDAPNVSGSKPGPGSGTPASSLLKALKAHDSQAWRWLAGLYGPLVYGWCRGRGLQPADAEDVLQEVFLTVASRIGDFRGQGEHGTFRGWLWVITRNK